MYTPTSRTMPGGLQGTWVQPGYGGGSNWNGAAFDPQTGWMYVPTKNQPMIATLTPSNPKLTDFDYVRATTTTVQGPRGLPITRPPWSKITATDMNSGEHRWFKAIGPAPDNVRNHPDLQRLGLDFANMGYTSIRPSPVLTKTLLFLPDGGALSGDPGGNMIRAYDKRNGSVVAEIELPSKSTGAPMTYMYKGTQYIVTAVSTAKHAAELVALAVPPKGQHFNAAVPNTLEVAASAATIGGAGDFNNGRRVYESNCANCHGMRGDGVRDVGPAIKGQGDFAAIMKRVQQGGINMPPMQTLLTADQIRDVSYFVTMGLK
jgi:quinoprotein glucose dehydrogenase